MRKFITHWLPPIAWMLLIFILSSKPRVTVTEEFLPDLIIFKAGHIVEYGILQFLMFRAIYSQTQKKTKSILWALFISLSYAISDEIHQSFIPTRNGQLLDVLIDSVGIGAVSLIVQRHFEKVIKFL